MLSGNRVILEEIDSEYLEWLRQQRNDPELRQYFRAWKDISKDQQQVWYKERGNNTNLAHVYFQIMLKSNDGCSANDIIGCCGLHYIDWRLRSAEFGIFLAPYFQGCGYGKEALTMLCDFGFLEMNLHKIWCEVFDNNKAIGLYRKLGFKDEGVLRDNYFCNGRYGNSYVMSILEHEWKEKKISFKLGIE